MGIDARCRWVRHRLPLLAGGELGMEERRRVERHLIGCLDCRGRRDASEGSLAVLRAFANQPPARAEAPSLWPALDRQIRQSRHLPARPSWRDRLGFRVGPAMGLGLSLGLGGLAVATLAPTPAARPIPTSNLTPRSSTVATVANPPTARTKPHAAPRPLRALPETPDRPTDLLITQGDRDAFEPPTTIRFEYVLDRGTPVGSGGGDPQRSY